ncbi:MAG: hypothetical protein ABIK28_22055 [Planctomycetota bacterium]
MRTLLFVMVGLLALGAFGMNALADEGPRATHTAFTENGTATW